MNICREATQCHRRLLVDSSTVVRSGDACQSSHATPAVLCAPTYLFGCVWCACVCVQAIPMGYVMLGGLRSSIMSDVLQARAHSYILHALAS